MPVHKVGNCRADMCSLKTVFLHHLPSFDLDPSPSMYFVYFYGVQCFSPSLEKTHLRALVFPHLLFLSDSMSLIVIDVVFLVAGLPSIVSAHLGFQDLVFGDLTSRLFFIARGCLHGLDGVFLRVCFVRLEGLRSYSFGALVSSIQSFVVLRWHEHLVCACLVCEVLLIS
ncbi:hypothetical protein DY000_02029875 [Brassica cretica]|uniref:Uncharacterized protein n=1 Tax=Brassica cretica TaxID=69181 RepID=A0ABQ7DZ58_BRACR|nr:hypothetical protein DY000_02029875 [Brassica cretica]